MPWSSGKLADHGASGGRPWRARRRVPTSGPAHDALADRRAERIDAARLVRVAAELRLEGHAIELAARARRAAACGPAPRRRRHRRAAARTTRSLPSRTLSGSRLSMLLTVMKRRSELARRVLDRKIPLMVLNVAITTSRGSDRKRGSKLPTMAPATRRARSPHRAARRRSARCPPRSAASACTRARTRVAARRRSRRSPCRAARACARRRWADFRRMRPRRMEPVAAGRRGRCAVSSTVAGTTSSP